MTKEQILNEYLDFDKRDKETKNWGLGMMTQWERRFLKIIRAIITVDGIDKVFGDKEYYYVWDKSGQVAQKKYPNIEDIEQIKKKGGNVFVDYCAETWENYMKMRSDIFDTKEQKKFKQQQQMQEMGKEDSWDYKNKIKQIRIKSGIDNEHYETKAQVNPGERPLETYEIHTNPTEHRGTNKV